MRRIQNIKSKLIVMSVIALWVLVMYLFDLPCPILHITGIRCPGCGMTRAIRAALQLDLMAAFSYHAMFWSIPILILIFLFDGKLLKHSALNTIFLVLIAAGFIFNWFFNIF